MIAAFCNGEPIASLPLDSRAAHYGDGIFTTIRVHAGRVTLWPLHRMRLATGCRALHLVEPDWDAIEASWSRILIERPNGVFKLALVPRSVGRGYARPWPSPADVYLFVYPEPTWKPACYRDGIDLATVRVDPAAHGPGLKTLSRLDQVLLAPPEFGGEALVCDRDGFVLGGAFGNVFALFGSIWTTPPGMRGTIDGVLRARVMQSPPPGFSIRVQAMHRDALEHAEAVFVCNAVRGVVPVRALDGRIWSRHAAVSAMMRAINPELGLPDA